ncbi:DNA-binding protein [Escherichia coli]|uniref:DNA-binding protein n=1 Tax=Escherichia coli TaxID=562 RepID=UPI001FCF04AD|nr:DNA-binding protein [Escherichia coli]
MSDECVKTHYSAQELADLSLPGIPSTRVGIAVKAKRDKWASRVREMKGGGVEYHIDSLPTETQKALRQRLAHQVLEDTQLPAVVEQKAVKNVTVRDELEVMVKCPELALREVQALTNKQKAIADARIRRPGPDCSQPSGSLGDVRRHRENRTLFHVTPEIHCHRTLCGCGG